MVTLAKNQIVLTDPEWKVVCAGDYEDDALVECVRISDLTQKCAFYAQFIATGEYPE